MPRRVIRLGLQPSQFSFQDEYGPLVNGLASAAESFMSGGQRRAELELAREQQAKAEEASRTALARQSARDVATDTRSERELKLREQEATDRRNASLRDDVGGLMKGVAGFFKGPSDAAQRLAFDKEQAKIKTDKPAKDVQGEHDFALAKQILGDENASPEDVAWARQIAGLPALPPPLPPEPTAADITAKNVAETGFPDRESNWYNPADWFRSAPTPAIPAAAGSLQDQVGGQLAQLRSPSGVPLVPTPEGGYIPEGFQRAPTPNPGTVISTGVPGDREMNEAQDATLEIEALKKLPPADQAAFQRILAGGDPDRIAEARRRLMAAAGF